MFARLRCSVQTRQWSAALLTIPTLVLWMQTLTQGTLFADLTTDLQAQRSRVTSSWNCFYNRKMHLDRGHRLTASNNSACQFLVVFTTSPVGHTLSCPLKVTSWPFPLHSQIGLLTDERTGVYGLLNWGSVPDWGRNLSPVCSTGHCVLSSKAAAAWS